MKFIRSGLAVLITVVLILNVCGCSDSLNKDNLMKDITPNKVTASEDIENDTVKFNEFSVDFFKNSLKENGNTLVSPLSAIYSLGMAANGAEGETLKELEKAFGMEREELNLYLYSLMKKIEKDETTTLNVANSAWFTNRDSFKVNRDFLQINADYYGADAYKAPFDASTIKKINKWVKNRTDGTIDNIVDDSIVTPNAVVVLINALCFEAEWLSPYENGEVRKGKFTSASGQKQDCDFMYGEGGWYYEDTNAVGFCQLYEGDYAFVAMLPNEGITVEEYIKSLNGERLTEMLKNPNRGVALDTAIPKFEHEFDFSAVDTLEKMGVNRAFDQEIADFSALGTSKNGNIYIGEVKQKTYISVAEKGTKAGAATAIVFFDKSSSLEPEKQIYLNRPFVYMIINTDTFVPIFMGTVNNI